MEYMKGMKKDPSYKGAFCGGYDKAKKYQMTLFNLMGKHKGGMLPMKDVKKKIPGMGK